MEFTLPFLLTLGTAWWFYPIEEHISIPKIIDAREKRMEARRLKVLKKEEERKQKEEARREKARKKEAERLYWEHLSEWSERDREKNIAKFMEEYRAKMKAKEQGK
ncbi:uncharacterized protein LOC141586001 [Silene latifolia]|uniref:uncharacterized protein LOC141586001 n=1 Tax=Silene latifolia TaxID=37657 RepID=UPI003D783D7F